MAAFEVARCVGLNLVNNDASVEYVADKRGETRILGGCRFIRALASMLELWLQNRDPPTAKSVGMGVWLTPTCSQRCRREEVKPPYISNNRGAAGCPQQWRLPLENPLLIRFYWVFFLIVTTALSTRLVRVLYGQVTDTL